MSSSNFAWVYCCIFEIIQWKLFLTSHVSFSSTFFKWKLKQLTNFFWLKSCFMNQPDDCHLDNFLCNAASAQTDSLSTHDKCNNCQESLYFFICGFYSLDLLDNDNVAKFFAHSSPNTPFVETQSSLSKMNQNPSHTFKSKQKVTNTLLLQLTWK